MLTHRKHSLIPTLINSKKGLIKTNGAVNHGLFVDISRQVCTGLSA